jgi:hypothetical protein
MLIEMNNLIKNIARVLVLLPRIIVEFLAKLVRTITEALLVPVGVGVQVANIVICVCILVVGILPVLKFLATIDHTG